MSSNPQPGQVTVSQDINFEMDFDTVAAASDDPHLPAIDDDNILAGSMGTRSPSPSFSIASSTQLSQTSETSQGSKRKRDEAGDSETAAHSSTTASSSLPNISELEDDNAAKRRTNEPDAVTSNGSAHPLRIDREKEGRCPQCGLQTHKLLDLKPPPGSKSRRFVKEPLSIEGEILNGRCLFCHPLGPLDEEAEANTNGGAKPEKKEDEEDVDQNRPFHEVVCNMQSQGNTAKPPSRPTSCLSNSSSSGNNINSMNVQSSPHNVAQRQQMRAAMQSAMQSCLTPGTYHNSMNNMNSTMNSNMNNMNSNMNNMNNNMNNMNNMNAMSSRRPVPNLAHSKLAMMKQRRLPRKHSPKQHAKMAFARMAQQHSQQRSGSMKHTWSRKGSAGSSSNFPMSPNNPNRQSMAGQIGNMGSMGSFRQGFDSSRDGERAQAAGPNMNPASRDNNWQARSSSAQSVSSVSCSDGGNDINSIANTTIDGDDCSSRSQKSEGLPVSSSASMSSAFSATERLGNMNMNNMNMNMNMNMNNMNMNMNNMNMNNMNMNNMNMNMNMNMNNMNANSMNNMNANNMNMNNMNMNMHAMGNMAGLVGMGGMGGMHCGDIKEKLSKNPQRQSPRPNNPQRSPVINSGQSGPPDPPSAFKSSQTTTDEAPSPDATLAKLGDAPQSVRLTHSKLISSIYHHHQFPLNTETELAYMDKTLIYLESGSGDICDIIAAMRRFPFSLVVQAVACEKLYVHCFDRDHAHSIGLVGGVRTVIDAMENHPADVALQRGCAGVIKHLAASSAYNLDMLDRMGAVNVIVAAMERHHQSAPLLESCCWALESMARGPSSELKMRVAKGGGIHAAMKAVESFPNDESLLRAAFHCLRQLGYNPSNYNSGQRRHPSFNGGEGNGGNAGNGGGNKMNMGGDMANMAGNSMNGMMNNSMGDGNHI